MEISCYKIESNPEYYYACAWDEYLFVTSNKVVTIQFRVDD